MKAFSSRVPTRVAGFTIVELAAALIVLTLVSTLAIRAWFARGEVTLQNAAELLVEDLRHMQARAILDHTPIEVVFDPDEGGYHGRELLGSVIDEGARRYPHDAVFEDVRLGPVQVSTGSLLMFDAQGHPASDASITLRQRDMTRTVVVRESSNAIEVRDSSR